MNDPLGELKKLKKLVLTVLLLRLSHSSVIILMWLMSCYSIALNIHNGTFGSEFAISVFFVLSLGAVLLDRIVLYYNDKKNNEIKSRSHSK